MLRDSYPHDSASTLAALYNEHFKVVPVDTPALLDEVYRLRYQVYCVEHRFEQPPDDLPKREIDHYDSHSVHSALIHRQSGTVVGAVRLILPRPDEGSDDLPIRNLLEPEARQAFDRFPRNRTAEASRYAVSKLFRQRQGEYRYPDVNADLGPLAAERRVMPYITLGLMRAVIEMSIAHGIEYIAAVMEPTLIRLLHRFGMEFDPVGPQVDYHGRRQPAIITPHRMLMALSQRQLDYWQADFAPAGATSDEARLVP